MQIQNALITGSFSYNGADLSNITSSNAYSASLSVRTTNLESTASSLVGASASFSSILTSVSSSQQQISSSLLNVIAIGATTGSNSFRATQSITGSLTVTGQIIAQTLNVQQVTSSIVFSSGSNNFGGDLNSRQTFTGSVIITGSLTVNTTGTEFQVNNNGVTIGNLLTDNHSITGSLRITGSLALAGNITGNAITLTGALSGTSATFSGNLNLQGAVTRNINFYDSSNTNINAQIQYDQISSNSGQLFFGTNNAGTFATRLTISNTGAATFVGSATFGSDVFTYANGGIFFNGGGSYGSGIFQQSGGALALQTGTTPRLTIASTGAATFTNTLSLNSASNTAGSQGFLLFNYTAANAGSRSWKISTDQNDWGDFAIQQSTTQTGTTYANILKIDATGNATFASNIYSDTGLFTGNKTVTISALNTAYQFAPVTSGIVTARDNTNGGSGVWLMDPNGNGGNGQLIQSSWVNGTYIIYYSPGGTYVQKTSGNVPVILQWAILQQ